jgi:diguanylate cyclase (GGDEF)-like protein
MNDDEASGLGSLASCHIRLSGPTSHRTSPMLSPGGLDEGVALNSIGDIDGQMRRSADRRTNISGLLSVRSWMLWSRPVASIGWILLLDLTALTAVAVSLLTTPISGGVIATAGPIVLAALLQGETSRRIERARRVISGSVHINMMSVWVFAAVLTLPTVWVGLVTAINSTHVVLRSYNVSRSYPHRQVMNAAALVLSGWGARAVLDAGHVSTIIGGTGLNATTLAVVAGAAIVFFVIDAVLIAVSLLLDRPPPAEGRWTLHDLIGSVDDNALEIATICLGAITAMLLFVHPVAILFVFVPLFVLHQSVLVKQLEELASQDQKTGLLNATAWNGAAIRELNRARRRSARPGVLMVDLDHFKRINDKYGHLAGDAVLKAVATTIKNEVRVYDSVGRFGGEEFVVFLPDLTESSAVDIAERIRQAIAHLKVEFTDGEARFVINTLSASIGVATYPDAGTALDRLLHAADTALYFAKHTGRNKVVNSMDIG